VVAALVGGDSFATMACELWHRHPPVRGDLACWGDALPEFVDLNPQLADVPYLADVARVEWALHRAAGVSDAAADPASFALLTQADPATFTLRLAPGTAVINSDWPVASPGDGAPSRRSTPWPLRPDGSRRAQPNARGYGDRDCARALPPARAPRRPCCRPW
jgi:hypothetical protein